MEKFDVLKSSCTPVWWAAAQNTTQTGPAANCIGTLRINFHGVRQYAAVDHGLWHTFVLRTKAGEQVLPPEGDSCEFTQARIKHNWEYTSKCVYGEHVNTSARVNI